MFIAKKQMFINVQFVKHSYNCNLVGYVSFHWNHRGDASWPCKMFLYG
jgi:hypothetical protein